MVGYGGWLLDAEQRERGRRDVGQDFFVVELGGACGDDERHWVERVRCVDGVVVVEHVVAVAVVGGDDAGAAGGVHGLDDVFEAFVDGLDRCDCCFDHVCVFDYVWVCEVDDRERWLFGFEVFYERVGCFVCVYLRFVVIRWYVVR